MLYLVLWGAQYILEPGTLILLNQLWYVDKKEIMMYAPVYRQYQGIDPFFFYGFCTVGCLGQYWLFPSRHQSYELQVRGPLSDQHSVQHYGEQDTIH